MSASIAKWLGYRSVNRKVASSIPSKATSVLLGYCSIAKWLGYRSVNRKVASSIPSKATSVLLGYCQDISFFAKWFGVGAMFSFISHNCVLKQNKDLLTPYFLLAWFNALVQERLCYAPLGWAKKYEFNESNLRMACDTLDTWLELIAQA